MWRVKVDTERCTGCGECVDGCFVNAIALEDDKAVITADCRGCGRCVSTCPSGAVTFGLDLASGVSDAITRISPLVDLR